MKKLLLTLAACTLSVAGILAADNTRTIKTNVPPRPAGQQDMIEFAAAPMEKVRVGIIGLGMRGSDAVERMMYVPGAEVVAVCDIEPKRVEKAVKTVTDAGRKAPAAYSGNAEVWKELCQNPDVDLVYIVTDWDDHAPMAIYAMENGKHAAIEVPAAHSLDQIWDLINTSERTRKHCMMLENCVYDFFELNTLNMAQKGLLGDVLHGEGAYIHNLKEFWPYYHDNWRLDFNRRNSGDVYATHGLGPVCQVMDIHRGDNFTTLVAMDTKAATGPVIWEQQQGEKPSAFANGDHTMSMLRTKNGRTVLIEHDVMNPRPYSRMYQITGTKGFANKYPNEGYAFEPDQIASTEMPDHQNLSAHGYLNKEQTAALLKEYTHPLITEIGEKAKEVGGHGGMDYIMDYRLIYCLLNGLPLDMDVYDLAEWCAITPLSQISLENGSAPVEFPDFTRGGLDKVKGYKHHYPAK